MAHSKERHPICSKVVNLTERPLNVYTSSGEIVTLEPKKKSLDTRDGTMFIVDLSTYDKAKADGEDTSYMVGASIVEKGRDNRPIVSLCRLDDFLRIYPIE